MKNDNPPAKKAGYLHSGWITALYTVAVTLTVALTQELVVLYAYLAIPLLFGLFYTFFFCLKAGRLRFLTPAKIKVAYDNPVDNYMRSEHDKNSGSLILAAVCFFPTLIFYILFGWAYYLRGK